ncbi:MAG: Hpt domain-containing protein [Rhodoferax sp.]|nr:Hpt domain-containing protein [Rhodoferax sp.]
MPPIPPAVFDPAVLGDMFNGDTAVMAAVLQTFAASTHAGLAAIQDAMMQGDLVAASLLAHKIKGACDQSGALAMGQAARVLEQAAKSGDAAASEAAARALAVQWQSLRAVLAAL